MKKCLIPLGWLLAVVMLAEVFGCASKPAPTAAPTPTPTPTPTPAPLTAAQILDRSSNKMQDVNSFHFALDQAGGGTPIAMGLQMNKAEGDVAKPDKLKAKLSGTIAGMSIEAQLITVGTVTYMTNPLTGSWEPLPAEFQALSVFDPSSGIVAVMKGISDATRLDDEVRDGVLAYHLKGSIDSGGLGPLIGASAAGSSIRTELWVGKDDFLLRGVKLEGKITESEVPGIVRTLKLSNFNQPVKIDLPK